MVGHHEIFVVRSRDLDNRLEAHEDAKDFESFNLKKGRYPNNREWIPKECDGEDNIAEMRKML